MNTFNSLIPTRISLRCGYVTRIHLKSCQAFRNRIRSSLKSHTLIMIMIIIVRFLNFGLLVFLEARGAGRARSANNCRLRWMQISYIKISSLTRKRSIENSEGIGRKKNRWIGRNSKRICCRKSRNKSERRRHSWSWKVFNYSAKSGFAISAMLSSSLKWMKWLCMRDAWKLRLHQNTTSGRSSHLNTWITSGKLMLMRIRLFLSPKRNKSCILAANFPSLNFVVHHFAWFVSEWSMQ